MQFSSELSIANVKKGAGAVACGETGPSETRNDEMMVTATLRFIVLLAAATAFSPSLHADPVANAAKKSGELGGQAARRARQAQIEFDAVTLQALIEPMMSGMKSGPLGSGPAGRYWQSLMTEHIARHLAASGRLRLLTRLPNTPSRADRMPISNRETRPTEIAIQKHPSASFWKTDVRRLTGEGGTQVSQMK